MAASIVSVATSISSAVSSPTGFWASMATPLASGTPGITASAHNIWLGDNQGWKTFFPCFSELADTTDRLRSLVTVTVTTSLAPSTTVTAEVLADIPQATQAGTAEEAEEADEAHARAPFRGDWTKIRRMCRYLCEEGWVDAVPVYQFEQETDGGSTVTVIYCQNCEAYGRVLNVTSSDALDAAIVSLPLESR
ncbi:hypothetical protein CMQ_4950 [Grosmannia clavigera kw1407]|uniref:Uncharacterized protein n=1 Tax=Grosmannia clavigera (strain kw1407 / UAMH 11150) TaxID=655863 RepID=F0XKD3_GROCL|nr:uncharacterized protein CMQ_4950 [Grosmannia clavigera kw1407]EFX01879.1 hypothetical protein CMQ_4950 [Grosmannia clavigera kw1407]